MEEVPISSENLNRTSQKETDKWENRVRRTVEVNGIKWEYREFGDAEKGIHFLQIPGWIAPAKLNDNFARSLTGEVPQSRGFQALTENRPESAEAIANEIKSLSGKYHVVVPELPGFGVTKHLKRPSVDAMVDGLADFLKAINVKEAIIFGGSFGGILAIKFGARYPEVTKALITQGTMMQPSDMSQDLYSVLQKGAHGWRSFILKTVSPIRAKVITDALTNTEDHKLSDPEIQEEVKLAIRKSHGQTDLVTARAIGSDLGDDIKKVQCAVIVADGAHGDIVQIFNSAKAAARFHGEIPESELVKQKKVVFLPLGGYAGEHGHNIVNSFPEGLAFAIDDMLNKMLKLEQKPAA